MATLGAYNPIFYAQEALIHLRKALGMANRVHRGFEAERTAFGLGETINIRKPSTFTAAAAPASAMTTTTETVAITLDNWREVKFNLTDKELAFSGERIINDHIAPAAYALADDVDQKRTALYKDIPWATDTWSATAAVSDITGLRKTLFNNNVPMGGDNLHLMVDGTIEAELLGIDTFHEADKAGSPATQMRGSLGTKFGMEVFANQNVAAHTKGTIDDTALLAMGAASAAATTITQDAADAGVSGTLVAGDTFVIAGNTQRYAVTATNTASGNVFTDVAITPALAAAVSDNAVVTVTVNTSSAECMAFHRNAFALVMAPLPQTASQLGARVVTVTDPVTGLSIRSRVYYVGNSSEVHVALDVLYGVKTLDPNLAARAYNA